MTATRRAVTRKQFLQISRTIKDEVKNKTYRTEEVADYHHVSPATVRTIRRAGTWPSFEAVKAAKRGAAPSIDQLTASSSVATDKPLDKRVADLEEHIGLMEISLDHAHERLGDHYEDIKNLKKSRRWWKR